jgi:hypothetical protein
VDTGEGTVSVAGGYTDEKVRASEAVTGSLTSGGSLNISAGGNARFEGTQVEAGKDAQIAAGGNVTMDAARNTYSAQSSGVQVEAGFGRKNEDDEEAGTTTKTRSASLGVQASTSSENSSDAVVGGVKAGGNLSVVAGGNARFEGTTLAAGEGAQVAAGGNVAFDAATSTREASSVGVGVGLGRESTSTRPTAGGDKESESEATAELSLDVSAERSRNQAGSTISAGAGGVQISAGRDVTMQGTQVATDGSADVSAGGKIEKRAAVSESSAVGFGLDLSASRKETVGGGDDAAEGEADAAKSDDKADDKAAAKDGDKSAAKADAKADDKADAKAAAKPAESDAEGAAAPEAGAEGGAEAGAEGAAAEPEVEKERSAGLRDITLERSTERVATSIDAAGGTRLRSGSAPATSIPGTSMVLRATRGADGSLRSAVPVPANRPAGTEVAATQPDGKPLPSWLKLDPATGVLSGQPPADFAGALNVVVAVPQADGSVRKIGVSFGDGAR